MTRRLCGMVTELPKRVEMKVAADTCPLTGKLKQLVAGWPEMAKCRSPRPVSALNRGRSSYFADRTPPLTSVHVAAPTSSFAIPSPGALDTVRNLVGTQTRAQQWRFCRSMKEGMIAGKGAMMYGAVLFSTANHVHAF
ncbi:hypothetical protein BP6252_08292 [Coleophoma cylindrospora]|uniref:Uncharacterized protein n=1 Tax=Coleophoma cylindrospora TaxID=1849047 RepID=A0A3D8R5E5_9HELO|nr:hypothetical protein BP6252_08292 [Coleophoma cylindrospora]